MISSNDLRPGITIELDGSVWQCVEFCLLYTSDAADDLLTV